MPRPPIQVSPGTKFGDKFPDGTVHQGWDLPPGRNGNDGVFSPVRGVVVDAGSNTPNSAGPTGFGPGFLVIDAFADGTRHTLAHLDPTSTEFQQMKKGTEVDEGELVGQVARGVVPSKFHSGVPHLHWEISKDGRKVDPLAWLATAGIPTSSLPTKAAGGNGTILLVLLGLLILSRNAR